MPKGKYQRRATYGVPLKNKPKSRRHSVNSEPRTISLSTGNLYSAVEEYLHRLSLIAKDEKVVDVWTSGTNGYLTVQMNKDEEVRLPDKKETFDKSNT